MKRKRFKTSFLLCALSFLAGYTGCGDDSGTSEKSPCDACTSEQTCISLVCYDNSSLCGEEHILCTDGETCVEGVCKTSVDPDACDVEGAEPCQEGYSCSAETHRCVKNEPVIVDPCEEITCLEGKTCLSSLADCIDTECIDGDKEKACPEGQMCSKGECIDDGCLGVTCLESETCVKGICRETACIDVLCDSEQTCVAGTCIDLECVDKQCDSPYVCSKGECMYSACIDKDPCKQGKICGEDGECHFQTAPAIVASEIADATTDEDGKSITIPFKLNNEPNADVTVQCEVKTSSPNVEANVECAAVLFNTENWAVEQTIVVTGVTDHKVDGDQEYTVVITTVSEDEEFNNLSFETPVLKNLNTDVANFIITPNEVLYTGEDGTTATFSITLSTIPDKDIKLTMTSSNPEAGTVSDVPVVINAENWNTPTEVVIQGVNDLVADGNKEYQINFAVETEDSLYGQIVPDPVKVINIDDDKPGIAFTPNELKTAEGGDPVVGSVKLSTQPTADVVLTLAIDNDKEAAIDLTELKFTKDNWNVSQEVKISGLIDNIIDGDQTYKLSLSSTSTDNAYKDLKLDVTGTNVDIDHAGIITTMEASPVVTEDGTSVDVKVSLTARPNSDVTIGVDVKDKEELSASADKLIFSSENWNIPQILKISGVDDDVIDGDVKSEVILTASSEDTHFNAETEKPGDDGSKVNESKMTFTTVDNDVANIIVTSEANAFKEDSGETVSMQVVLSAKPESMVFVTINSSDAMSLNVTSGNSVVFTADNWNQPQTVTAKVIDDIYAENNKDVVISFTSASSDSNFNGLKATSATYTIIDNETANIVMTASPDTLSQPLGIKTSTITAVLSGAPSTDVTINLTAKTPTSTTLSTSSLKFTSTTWNIPQTFTATTNFTMPLAYDTETITGTAKGSVYDGKSVKVNLTIVSIPKVQNFEYSGVIDDVVLYPGKYKVEVWGAQGGDVGPVTGHAGAYSISYLDVSVTETFKLLVGQKGGLGAGGGGTFFVHADNTPVAVAGAGGGAGGPTVAASNKNIAGTPNVGQATENGGSTYGDGGGKSGAGGNYGVTNGPASGGGGMLTDGKDSTSGARGLAFVNGGAGGTGYGVVYISTPPGNGGFGGGAGAYNNNTSGYVRGGGGGGYSGGQGGTYSATTVQNSGGGGGGSYHSGASSNSIAGNASMPAPAGGVETGHLGNGYARISIVTD